MRRLVDVLGGVVVAVDHALGVDVVAGGLLDQLGQARVRLVAQQGDEDQVHAHRAGERHGGEHLLLGLADVAHDEVGVEDHLRLAEHGEPLADLLDVEPLAHRLQRRVLRRLDADQQGDESGLLHLAQDVGTIGDLRPGVDDVVFANPLGDQQVADLDDAVRLMGEHVVDEEDQVGVDLLDLADDRRRQTAASSAASRPRG